MKQLISAFLLGIVCIVHSQTPIKPDSVWANIYLRQSNVISANVYMYEQIKNPKNFRTWLNLSAQPLQLYLFGDTTLVDSLLDIVYPKSANYNATWDSVVKSKLGVK